MLSIDIFKVQSGFVYIVVMKEHLKSRRGHETEMKDKRNREKHREKNKNKAKNKQKTKIGRNKLRYK